MKAIVLIAVLFFQPVLFAGNWSGGGGDPIPVKVEAFPDQKMLDGAIALLKQKIQETPFIEEFKTAFLNDLITLEQNKAFLFVPELFAVGFSRYPGDYNRLVSNGAMTEFKQGSPIYFSKQALKYDSRSLARVIAQEIPHHIFKTKFGRDEVFVNALGTYIVEGGENIPTQPYPAVQIIYEEFLDLPFRESTGKIIRKAQEDLQLGKNTLSTLFRLAQGLYRDRGSYSWYNVEIATFINLADMSQYHDKIIKITKSRELIHSLLEKCTFATYEDGPGGFDKKEQEITVNAFMLIYDSVDDIDEVYYVEDPMIATMKKVTNCAIGLENSKGEIMIYGAVFRHSDDQTNGDVRP